MRSPGITSLSTSPIMCIKPTIITLSIIKVEYDKNDEKPRHEVPEPFEGVVEAPCPLYD